MSKIFVYLFLVILFIAGLWSLIKLDISEDLDTTIPNVAAFNKIKPLLDKGKKSIVFSIAINPSEDTPYSIKKQADSLILVLNKEAKELVGNLQYKSDIDPDIFSHYFYTHLYLFLDSTDYILIKNDLSSESIDNAMLSNKASLYSPEGLALKDWILKDPLHLTKYGYNKLKQGTLTDDFINNEGLFISTDKQKLLIYGELKYNPSESKKNSVLSKKLSRLKNDWNLNNPHYKVDYFGTFLIADANATQIEKDIKVTISIAMLCILALLFYYFRNILVIVFFLLPGVFGVLFAIIGIYLWQGQISGIALSAGAVVMGIVVDYSFHFFSQLKQNNSAKETRKSIFLPLVLSGTTTIVAFLSLTFANSRALHDFGLFTALSLIGTLIFVLAFLPLLLQPFEKKLSFANSNKLDSWFDKINLEPKRNAKWFALAIVAITIFFFYFATDVQFENNLNKLNFYPEQLKKAEIAHQNINPDKDKRIFLLVEGFNSNDIAKNNTKLFRKLSLLTDSLQIKQINSLGLFVLSEEEQQRKIDLWNNFWRNSKDRVWKQVKNNSDSLGFNENAFLPFKNWLDAPLQKENLLAFVQQSHALNQLILSSDSENTSTSNPLITSVVLPKKEYEKFTTYFNTSSEVTLVDGTSVMAMLTKVVKDDFNYLLIFASILVFVAMLLIYGSLELTLVSFIPIAISWVWILGISALLNFKFNFVNIIIITFIFGLGDDFAIFITDGLQTKYKYGRKILSHYKSGIILSSISTIIGTGVLIFAKHPAIKSIAAISVTGILTIVFVSFYVQPLIFHFFTTRRTNSGKPPVTIVGIITSITGYLIFISGSLLGVFLGFIIRFIPFKNRSWKKNRLHHMLKWITGTMLDILFSTTKRYYNMQHLDFSKPSILIANHTSFFDILALARLNPNIIMLVNKWVYDSVLFGNAIRYADYVPTFESLDENVTKVKKLVDHGYSIVVFPEGTRSPDGKIKRFHKGAFYLADLLKLDITPVVLHGYGYTMPKHDYNLKDSLMSTYVLPRIKYNDTTYGIGYKERTKSISAYFKKSYKEVDQICGATDYQFYPLLYSYKYKGPILEWYFRIKWKFEKHHYEKYYSIIGSGSKRIYDLGCGYGFLSHYLKLRNESFTILGYDYDEDKIDVAQNSYLKTGGIDFRTSDIAKVQPVEADAIIIADTLHYLTKNDQNKVLIQCNNGLKSGGLLLIRDGLSDLETGHNWTKTSENWSTKYLRFNKTKGDLHFFTKQFIEDWAMKNHFSISFDHQSSNSSNTLMILRKK